ncbi:hypothetical protein ACEQPO_21130 [Bacillus sp. SL00103]
MEIARASIIGQPVHLLSPLVASTLLLVSMLNKDIGDLQRYALLWTVLTALFTTLIALLTGAISIFKYVYKKDDVSVKRLVLFVRIKAHKMDAHMREFSILTSPTSGNRHMISRLYRIPFYRDRALTLARRVTILEGERVSIQAAINQKRKRSIRIARPR